MAERGEKIRQLRAQAMALPLRPGVYLMKDAAGTIIYIGKAKALKNRVSQYFGSDTNHPEKVRQMVAHVDRFDTIVVDSEFEALVLECSLIKQYAPKYNILLKDDKGYRYIRVSPPPYSRITECKQLQDDGARYIGPYMSSFGIKQAIDEANKVFGLPTCNRQFTFGKKPLRTERPCLNHYIGQCCAPCTGRVTEADYAERVENALELILQGSAKIRQTLRERMEKAAEDLQFEKAADLRDRLRAVERMGERQKVVMSRVPEQDVLGTARGDGYVCFAVLRFVHGALTDKEEFLVDDAGELPGARAEFLRRYYSLRDRVPPQVTLDGETEDKELLEEWLSGKAGRRVRLVQPQRGEQAQLSEMCRQNAAEAIARKAGISGRDAAALDELASTLGLPQPPRVIECYDISHTGGADAVAGMVVFENGRPLKAGYRKFKIRTAIAGDDYGAMREVIGRRLEEYQKAAGTEGADETDGASGAAGAGEAVGPNEAAGAAGGPAGGVPTPQAGADGGQPPAHVPDNRAGGSAAGGPADAGSPADGPADVPAGSAEEEAGTQPGSGRPDASFGRLPDLILLDGGQEHVRAVAPVLERYGVHIPLFGLVKDDRHRTRAIAVSGGEIAIHSKRAVFTLLSNIQEEVHRFAIGYHRQTRKKTNIHTALTAIDGVGEARARALLRQFGSLRGVKQASVEELCQVRGITRPVAENIVRYFENRDE